MDKNEEETLEELNSRAISRIASGQSNTRSNQAMSVGVASSNADTTKIPGLVKYFSACSLTFTMYDTFKKNFYAEVVNSRVTHMHYNNANSERPPLKV